MRRKLGRPGQCDHVPHKKVSSSLIVFEKATQKEVTSKDLEVMLLHTLHQTYSVYLHCNMLQPLVPFVQFLFTRSSEGFRMQFTVEAK